MIEIIPAIDLIGGKCVRLTQGNYDRQQVYSDDPVATAIQFEQAGCARLHLVDLDGARSGTIKNLPVLEKIAAATSLQIDFSGGVRTADACNDVINAGAAFIGVGSVAARHPAIVLEWMAAIGQEKFLLGADVKDCCIAVNGWQESTAIDIRDFIAGYFTAGVRNFFCTDIARDGMMQGPSALLYRRIVKDFEGIRLIASGGVSSREDIPLLEEAGCSGIIIGKALYEGTIKLKDLC